MKDVERRILFTIADMNDYPVTAIDPCSDMIVLSRGEDSDEEIEREIEEVVNHECLHIVIKRVRNYAVCSKLDSVSGWTVHLGERYKIVFISKKALELAREKGIPNEECIFQLPE